MELNLLECRFRNSVVLSIWLIQTQSNVCRLAHTPTAGNLSSNLNEVSSQLYSVVCSEFHSQLLSNYIFFMHVVPYLLFFSPINIG